MLCWGSVAKVTDGLRTLLSKECFLVFVLFTLPEMCLLKSVWLWFLYHTFLVSFLFKLLLHAILICRLTLVCWPFTADKQKVLRIMLESNLWARSLQIWLHLLPKLFCKPCSSPHLYYYHVIQPIMICPCITTIIWSPHASPVPSLVIYFSS